MHAKYTVPLMLACSLLSSMDVCASDDEYLKAVKKCPPKAGPERDTCLSDAIETRDRLKRAEQEELMNRPATGTGIYRCVSGDGRRNTRDKHDVRLGEYCGELTQEEVAKMKAEAKAEATKLKAEANRPPTDSEKSQMTTRARQMDHWDRCVEVGRVLRQTNQTPRQQYWTGTVLTAAQVSTTDHGYIRERRIRIGMSECALFAALGKPEAANSTHTARGRSTQFVYRQKGLYVYTDDGLVKAWQN